MGPEGPPGPGCIKVYDADGQYLGILLELAPSMVGIFIPSPLNVAAFIRIVPSSGHYEQGHFLIIDRINFEGLDCTGPAYISNSLVEHALYRLNFSYDNPRYFYGVGPKAEGVPIWSHMFFGVPCLNYPNGTTGGGWHAKEIMEEDIPFTLPVALPLRYECQSE